MDLSFDDELSGFRTEVRNFLAANWHRASRSPDSAEEREFREKAVAKGYLYRGIPRIYGGSEQPPDALKGEIIRQEFARAKAPTEFARGAGVALLVPTLLEWGEDWQKEKFIAPSLRGDLIWCQGYSEPSAGSDLASLRTRAELIDGEWVITGQKIWTSHAFVADYMFILVRTEPDAPKHKGISYLLLDMRQPGITIRPLKQITGKADFCEVFFDGAKTPADWIIGERGNGWTISRTTLKHERTSMRGLNFQEARFRDLTRLAKIARVDGAPAIEAPAVRQRMAMLEASIACMRYSAYRQFSMEVAGDDPGLFPLLRKLYSSNIAATSVQVARDMLGDDFLLTGDGDGPEDIAKAKWVHTYFTSLILAIAGGSSNIQRNIIAERGLGLPRERSEP
jgi:alkylation response protein AidB-like acyl-CoA dehydrogenase